MIAKAGLGLIGLSAISVGGVALTKPSWLGMGDPMPDCHLLFEDSDYESRKGNDYGTNKFGGKYKSYLVGVTHKKDSNPQKTNEFWWEWSFRRLEKDNGSDSKPGAKFANAKKHGTGTDSINKICEAAYKAEPSSSIDTAGSSDKYKEADIWKYCSILGSKPTTIESNQAENSSYKEGELGKTQNNKLISILDKNNDKFWEIRNKEFKGEGHDKIETDVDNFFNPASGTIKELCEKAYKTKGTGSSNPTSEKVTKYCSLDKQ